MDFKNLLKYFAVLIVTITGIFGCTKKEKSNMENTFYIELVNFKYDSLKISLAENIFGKVSFYRDKELEIVSLNYVTDDFPPMHYFRNAEMLKKEIKAETKKIRIEFKGEFSIDSINYSLQKFRYRNNTWIKTSDMGVIKDIKKFVQPVNIINEYVRLIVLHTVQYSYN